MEEIVGIKHMVHFLNCVALGNWMKNNEGNLNFPANLHQAIKPIPSREISEIAQDITGHALEIVVENFLVGIKRGAHDRQAVRAVIELDAFDSFVVSWPILVLNLVDQKADITTIPQHIQQLQLALLRIVRHLCSQNLLSTDLVQRMLKPYESKGTCPHGQWVEKYNRLMFD